uniref:Calponin-homology (CH) domain-containing protein n=1 Tax=Caenorhabditis tropicalis TaxID=1561998 RepID=A0A1I7UJ21_9PELO
MSSLENKREAKLKRLAELNESRILKSLSSNVGRRVDLRTTEKAFLDTSPSAINMKTPLDPSRTVTDTTDSPILSSEERADKQIVALSTWANTLMGVESSEEMDLGATAAEATRRIQRMLKGEKKPIVNKPSLYQNILGNKDQKKVREACQKLLADSEMKQSIRSMLSKKRLEIRKEVSVYNDLTVQTTLLRIFLSFNPKLLKVVLEAIFNTEIGAPLIRNISQILIDRVFSNPVMLKNKKFAQGSGVPIITAAGREALHNHFLESSMKMMFLVESTYSHRLIPSVTRVFTKSSQFKSLTEMCNELTRELLAGSSQDFAKAFSSIGFKPTYVQSFVENHNYEAKGFEDFSDGLILAKLIETVGELPHGQILYKLRDPAGDRIRKIKNVETVLKEMTAIGIPTEDVTPAAIVGGKKEAIVSLLWSIVGVRVAKEKRERYQRPLVDDLTTPKKKKRQSGVHDDMSTEVLTSLKSYCRVLQMEVFDLDSIQNGCVLEQIWLRFIPNAPPIESYSGVTSWERIVTFSEMELQIPRGLDQNVALFVKTFLERVEMIRKHEESDHVVRKSDIGTQSMNSTLNDATFTISRESMDSTFGGSGGFKTPITPLRGTFTRTTIAKHLNEVIEEEETETEKDLQKTPTRSDIGGDHSEVVAHRGSTESEETLTENRVSEEAEALKENQDISAKETPEKAEEALEEAEEASEKAEGLKDTTIMSLEEEESASGVDQEQAEKKASLQEMSEEGSKDLDGGDDRDEKRASENRDEEKEKTLVNSESPDVDETITTHVIAHALGSLKLDPITNVETSPLPIATETTIQSFLEPSESATTAETPEEVTSEPSINATSSPHNINTETKPESPESSRILSEVAFTGESEASEGPRLSESMIQIGEEQKRDSDFFQSYIENQKAFIAKNNLDYEIKEDPKSPSNTPELRRILRETRELKRKQMEIFQAKKLGAIERSARASRACSPSCSTALDDRSDAGHDEAMVIHNETSNLEEKLKSLEETKKISDEEMNRAAVVIQKMFRGLAARRTFRQEIGERRERMIVYTKALEVEKQQMGGDDKKSSSLETKLRHSALYGLTNENLHVVLIGATIIDRITDLYPPLLEKFVLELNGIELIYDILAVTDQGYAYKAILQPLLRCLQKSFTSVPESKTNAKVQPILPKLSPRLFLLMLKHSTSPEFFNPIITTLIAIGRRFPKEKDSGMRRWKNQIEQTMKKVTDRDGKQYLFTLQTICDHLL